MPLPLIALAIPVLHSSGAWIATATGGYIAGTMSSTWTGAFILGNSGLLTKLGLVSGAAIFSASGGTATTVTLATGTMLTKIGLGGLAISLGIAPVATFLGLSPAVWLIAGATALVTSIGVFIAFKTMRRINEERAKGGLEHITLRQVVKEVRLLEDASMNTILLQRENERGDVAISNDGKTVLIGHQKFSTTRLKYVVNQDGSEEIVFVSKSGRKKRILLIKAASGPKMLTT